MREPRRSDPGFTLVELMIVVALIGALSAIAIPSYMRFQLRAKVSEATTNLAAIALTQEAFFTEKGFYVSVADPAPATIPGNTRVTWTGNEDFDELGWIPEGSVYFQYLISADHQSGGRFTAEAAGDVDADGTPSFFGYVKPSGGSGIDGRLDGSTCEGTGVFNPASGTKSAKRVAGPCDASSGRGVF
jgi:type IV pilus assembly protein PilA